SRYRDVCMSAALINSMKDEELEQFVEQIASMPNERVKLLQRLLGDSACRQLGLRVYPDDFMLSVVIPVYNEKQWVRELVRRVQAVPVPKEIVIVDDCSTDGTRDILRQLEGDGIRVVLHEKNQGKGAALRTGFQHATGTVVVVQDADLEYDPAEYPRLIQPIL